MNTEDPAMEKAASTFVGSQAKGMALKLRLYIARSTPNSIRAQHNLTEALKEVADADACAELEIVDVFTHPKRAVIDGIIITPTLIGIGACGRMTLIGDLADSAKLAHFLDTVRAVDG